LKKQLTFGAALLALSLGVLSTAHAQYGPAYPRAYAPGLAPHHVVAIVRSTGMVPLMRPVRRGPNYVVVATDRTGAQMRVLVNAFDGAIVRVRPLVAMQPRGAYGRGVADPYAPRPRAIVPPRAIKDAPPVVHGAAPYDSRAVGEDAAVPLPPRSVPSARVANAPSAAVPPAAAAHSAPPPVAAPPSAPHTLAAHPKPTPLPRPRPAVASNDVGATAPAPVAATPEPPAAKPEETEAWPVPTKPAGSETKPGEIPDQLKLVPVAPLD
jgi:hypothetical protein